MGPKLPPGYVVGMRVVTNGRYAACHPRSPKRRRGTIVGGSNASEGRVVIKLDDQKHPKPLSPALFDLLPGAG